MADQRKEVTDDELESLVADELRVAQEIYALDYMHVVSGGTTIPTATVRLRQNGQSYQGVASGVGSVDAVYSAIDSLIKVPHQLVDYNVSSVTGGTDALGEVMVRISDRSGQIHTGRGSSMDIIEASAKAYLQALNKAVVRSGQTRPTCRTTRKKGLAAMGMTITEKILAAHSGHDEVHAGPVHHGEAGPDAGQRYHRADRHRGVREDRRAESWPTGPAWCWSPTTPLRTRTSSRRSSAA